MGQYGSFDPTDEVLSELADKTGTTAALEAYFTARDDLEHYQQVRPTRPILDPDLPYRDKILADKRYDLDMAKYTIDEQRMQRKSALTIATWRKLVLQNVDFKKLVTKVNAYNRNISKYTSLCKDKGQLAKLNISIGSEKMRASLRSLVDFVIDI
jgi:hypothetical protein